MIVGEVSQARNPMALFQLDNEHFKGLSSIEHARQWLGIIIKSPLAARRAEEAPGAYKDVADVVEDADEAGLSKKVAKPAPLICVKG